MPESPYDNVKHNLATKPSLPQEPDTLCYETVANRRLGYDSMMWQTPVLSLTAQAFLLTIALGAGSTRAGRLSSSLLSVLISASSIQLMLKHRSLEKSDSEWLFAYEVLRFRYDSIHVPARKRPFFSAGRLGTVSSFRVWLVTLALFGLIAMLPAFAATFGQRWFD